MAKKQWIKFPAAPKDGSIQQVKFLSPYNDPGLLCPSPDCTKMAAGFSPYGFTAGFWHAPPICKMCHGSGYLKWTANLIRFVVTDVVFHDSPVFDAVKMELKLRSYDGPPMYMSFAKSWMQITPKNLVMHAVVRSVEQLLREHVRVGSVGADYCELVQTWAMLLQNFPDPPPLTVYSMPDDYQSMLAAIQKTLDEALDSQGIEATLFASFDPTPPSSALAISSMFAADADVVMEWKPIPVSDIVAEIKKYKELLATYVIPEPPGGMAYTSHGIVYYGAGGHDDVVGGYEVRNDLSDAVPALKTALAGCPVKCGPHVAPIMDMVVHLNDGHRWTREQIADWLDTLDADLSFVPAEERKQGRWDPEQGRAMVVAYSYEEARRAAYEAGFKPNEWGYVDPSDPWRQLRGCKNVQVLFADGWQRHRLSSRVLRELEVAGYDEITRR